MKKKLSYAIALTASITSGISIVYADSIILDHYFIEYNFAEQVQEFIKTVNPQLLQLTAIMTGVAVILGIIIWYIKRSSKEREDKNVVEATEGTINEANEEVKNKECGLCCGLEKIYFCSILVLNLLQIQVIKYVMLFWAEFNEASSTVEFKKAKINRFALPMMNVVYLIALIGVIVYCVKTKNEKKINTIMTFVTIATFVICAITVLSTGAGYYVNIENEFMDIE